MIGKENKKEKINKIKLKLSPKYCFDLMFQIDFIYFNSLIKRLTNLIYANMNI